MDAEIIPFPTVAPSTHVSQPGTAFPIEFPSFRSVNSYFLRDIDAAPTLGRAQVIARDIVLELDRLQNWVRDQDLQPPQWIVSPNDPRAKAAL